MIKIKLFFLIITCTFFVFTNAHAKKKPIVEQIIINPKMELKILNSPFKTMLRKSDGTKMMAYLYADDETKKLIEYPSCITGKEVKSMSSSGHYFLYLYDVKHEAFIPYRTRIFKGFYPITLNIEGATLIVLSGHKENTPDVWLMSQFGHCGGDYYEAYGFLDGKPYLQPYMFIGKEKQDEFYGRVSEIETMKPDLYGYALYDGLNGGETRQFTLSLSDKPGEILVVPKSFD